MKGSVLIELFILSVFIRKGVMLPFPKRLMRWSQFATTR